ncbi:AbrB/MazE/SpoVT family DNA-binding domain-containing protein [Peribacillus sp. FSL M8-0224]|uniref:AbrB/MazE/SpoVT family DNA-binding domain-containing protein n=1 Tax=Peribacillus sp. FSL M8-0224 TaxID=2921568 RepID=UPI0007BEC6B4|nr:AbrB/MazE/SpoVT family DNA-binding domain-containing protein [Brevibacterium sp. PAMC21349]
MLSNNVIIKDILKINLNGQLYIPKAIRNFLPFKEGEMVSVYQKGSDIIIEKSLKENIYNNCVFHFGGITIPAEIRKLQKIDHKSLLAMELSIGGEKLILRK